MERLVYTPKFLQMVSQLHENQCGQIRLNGDISESFVISNGVKQSCVLPPTLFSIFFSMMLKQATGDLDDDRGCTSGTVGTAVSSIYDASKTTPRRRRG